jgi:tight adherence protein C
MAGLISLTLFLLLTVVISYYGYRRYARPGRVITQLNADHIEVPLVGVTPDAAGPGLLVTAVEYVGEKLPVMSNDASVIRNDLSAAGYRSERAFYMFHGARLLIAALLGLLVLSFQYRVTTSPVLMMVLPVAATILGVLLPSLFLNWMVRSRQDEISSGLPDAIDLLVVAVEAGLGLDQALLYVARELAPTHPEVSDELHLVNLEIRAGQRRVDALRHLARRSGDPEMQKLVAMLIQADRFGTSIGESLRTHSEFMRTRRRQRAEEKAGKIGVKLVFPIFFLILPAMLVVTTGPGLLQVFKFLIPMMRETAL